MMVFKEAKNEKGVLKIVYDCDDGGPREWDNLGKMVCFHNKYNFGDKHNYHSGDYSSWSGLESSIRKEYDIAILLPLYLYDHSGQTISTSPFSCPWDSGQIGFIFATKEDIRRRYRRKRVTKGLIEKAKKSLLSEVSTYDDYIRGDVYGFVLEDKEGNIIDSCSGFYGNNAMEGLSDYIPEEYTSLLQQIA